MSDGSDLYLYADETVDLLTSALAKAREVYDLADEKRGPLTAQEKERACLLAADTKTVIGDALIAAGVMKDEAEEL